MEELEKIGGVAQLGERSVRIREVEGSNPFVSTVTSSGNRINIGKEKVRILSVLPGIQTGIQLIISIFFFEKERHKSRSFFISLHFRTISMPRNGSNPFGRTEELL